MNVIEGFFGTIIVFITLLFVLIYALIRFLIVMAIILSPVIIIGGIIWLATRN